MEKQWFDWAHFDLTEEYLYAVWFPFNGAMVYTFISAEGAD